MVDGAKFQFQLKKIASNNLFSCFTIRIENLSKSASLTRQSSTVRLHKRKEDDLYINHRPRFEPATFLIHDLSKFCKLYIFHSVNYIN